MTVRLCMRVYYDTCKKRFDVCALLPSVRERRKTSGKNKNGIGKMMMYDVAQLKKGFYILKSGVSWCEQPRTEKVCRLTPKGLLFLS